MTDVLFIRPAVAQDAERLVAFNRAMAKETEGIDLSVETLSAGVAALLKQPQYGFYLVAEIDGEVVGSLMVTYEWSDWRDGLFWWIQSVYVVPAHRGEGIYKRLYGEVKRRAAGRGGMSAGFVSMSKRRTVAPSGRIRRSEWRRPATRSSKRC